MGQTVDIGTRIELVSMDPHFHDITISLYYQESARGPIYLLHTYSRLDRAGARVDSVKKRMIALGGLQEVPESGLLRFACGAGHAFACKRLFLESCKEDPDGPIEIRPLTTLDKKSGLDIRVISLGNGAYQVTAEGDHKDKDRRISVVVNGLRKLGEMSGVEGRPDQVAFPCGASHDALVGLLLVRAPNVRAIVREQEMAAARGVLAAPSQQK